MLDTGEERAAILRVIEEETAAYFRKDFDAWAACWLQDPRVCRFAWYPHCGVWLVDGWESESATMRESMARFPAPNPSGADVRRERVQIRLGADMAWVTFDQYAPRTGDPFDVAGLQHQLRIMEKHEGAWKIACVGVLQPWLGSVDYPVIRVDADAKVLSMNDHARQRLAGQGLMLGAGRLRARDRAGNRGLMAAIRWAGGAIGYMSGQAARAAAPTVRGALPVVLGGDDPGVRLCWVSVEGDMILVTFDDGQWTAHSLTAAGVVYGLSPAQLRLARRVVEGDDLATAAAALGISVNTARTHLTRIFDKTGVRSQPALVRVLLSALAPSVS